MNPESGVVGVSWNKGTGKWCSTIWINNKQYFLGYFRTIKEARIAREQAEKRIADGTFFDWYEEKTSRPKGSSGIAGVGWSKQESKWRSRINIEKKCYCLGYYATIEEARTAREQAEDRVADGTFFDWYKEKMSLPRKYEDLTGKRFGRLVALRREPRKGAAFWICKCDCGNETSVNMQLLKSGATRSCGCLQREVIQARSTDLTGQRFDWLLVIGKAERRGRDGATFWKCQCHCGNIVEVERGRLLSGNTKSCGCRARTLFFVGGTHIPKLEKKTLSRVNTSGVTGVYRCKENEKWTASITFKGKRYHLGTHDNIDEAARARKQAEEQLHGPFLEWYEVYKKSLMKKHRSSEG